MRSTKRTRAPRVRFTTASDGSEIAQVELTNVAGLFATLDAEDWRHWSAQHGPNLFLNDNGRGTAYVRARDERVAGQIVTVARELVSPGRGVCVRYRDGDRLNLRRLNLATEHGPSARGQSPGPMADELLAAA